MKLEATRSARRNGDVRRIRGLIMWVRKSEVEIRDYLDRQEAKKKSLLRPLLFALILTVIAVIIYSLGYRGGWLRGGLVVVSNPSGVSLRTVFVGIFFFAFFFAIALYYRRRSTSSYSATDSLLCRKCVQPFNANPSAACQCGGKLEPFAFFIWVEDEKPSEG